VACSFCVIKIATSRISPAWRSHSQRVLISVHSEQLCLFGCPSSVLLPCVSKKRCKAFVRLVRPMAPQPAPSPVHVAHDTRAYRHPVSFSVLHKSYGSPNRSILFAHLGVRKNLGLAIFSNTFPEPTHPELGTSCHSAHEVDECRDDYVPFP
jgi:hypothetical protein